MSNKAAAEGSDGLDTASSLARAGRVIGYYLLYGGDLTNTGPVGRIDSAVTDWRTAADARRAFKVGNRNVLKQAAFSRFGVATTILKAGSQAIGAEHAAFNVTYRIQGGPTVHCAYELVSDRRYTLHTQACGASRATVQRLDQILIRRLDERLRLALTGQLHGKPIQGPSFPKPGPPAHGPKPATLALTPRDLPAKTRQAGYYETDARSYFSAHLSHARPFVDLWDDIYLLPNGPTAIYWAAGFLYRDTNTHTYFGATAPVHAHSINLAGVPDHPLAQIVRVPLAHGHLSYDAHIALRNGPWLEFVTAHASSPIPTSELTKLARLAARRLNSGLSR